MLPRIHDQHLGGGSATISDTVLAAALDHTSDGLLVAEARGVILYANTPLLQMFGYDAEQVIGQRVEMLLPEDSRTAHRKFVADYEKDPHPRSMGRDDLDIEGRRADGTRFAVDVQLSPLPGSSFVVAAVRDMTEHRHLTAERALRNIDLGNARVEVDRLKLALDLIVQRLFALGTSIEATKSNEARLAERMSASLSAIDEIITGVRTVRGG